MSDLNNNAQFNLPAYLHIPFFLYRDNRLEKSALLIAAFFYSLHTAGRSINASKDYLCELAGIGKSQYFCILNQLESFGYIKRTGFTNRKKMQWVYSPNSEIIVDESDTSPVYRTPVEKLDTSPVDRTKLVRSTGLNLSGRPDTYTKEDTKDYKKLTTVNPTPSSSSFFSEKQKEELLSHKIKDDDRPDELFLAHCTFHVEQQKGEHSKYQRFTGIKNILIKCYETNEHFQAKGFNKISLVEESEPKTFTEEDFNNWRRGEKGFDWVGPLYNKHRAQG